MGTDRFARDLALLLAAVPAAFAVTLAAGRGAPGIVLAASAAWLFLVRHRAAPRGRLIAALGAWAAAWSLLLATFTALDPARAAALIPRAEAYWNEMRPWLWTGEGKEANPAAWLPEHLLHLAGFALLAAATGGWAGLVLGAWLLGYMSYWVGQVAAHGRLPLVAGTLAWVPWSVLRVAAFLVLGVALSRLLLDREGLRAWWRAERGQVAAAGALWLGDALLKAVLAPHWPAVIRAAF